MLSLEKAAEAIKAGCVVAYPTEAVYGLGCDPFNAQAVVNLWALKQRPSSMGLILVASSWEQLEPWMGRLSEQQVADLWDSWPGAMTWVVPASDQVPHCLTGGLDTIALRWSAHPVVAALCDLVGSALVSTSANKHGEAPARSADEVSMCFFENDMFAGVVEGELGHFVRPTPIRNLISGEWIRHP